MMAWYSRLRSSFRPSMSCWRAALISGDCFGGMVRSPLEALGVGPWVLSRPFKVTSSARLLLQQRDVLPEERPGPDEIGVAQIQLARDAADLGLLDARDLAIRGGDREEAFQERRLLLVARAPPELPGHHVALGRAEELVLGFRDAHDEDGLVLREPREGAEDVLHRAGLLGTHFQIGMRHAAQNVGERREVAGALRREPVDRVRDLAHRAGRSPVFVIRAEAEELAQDHRAAADRRSIHP